MGRKPSAKRPPSRASIQASQIYGWIFSVGEVLTGSSRAAVIPGLQREEGGLYCVGSTPSVKHINDKLSLHGNFFTAEILFYHSVLYTLQ